LLIISDLKDKPVENFYPLLNRLMEFMSFDDAMELTIYALRYMPGSINIQELLRCDPADISQDEILRLSAKYAEFVDAHFRIHYYGEED